MDGWIDGWIDWSIDWLIDRLLGFSKISIFFLSLNRYFPDVGLSPDKVHEIMDSITAKDRNNDPLFSSANVPPSPHYTQQHHQNSLPLASAPSTYPQVHLGDMGAYSNSGGPSHSGFMPNSSNGHVAGPLSVQTRAVTAAASSSSNLSLNELLASPNGNPATQDEKLMQLLALRQRVIQQQQQQQQTQVRSWKSSTGYIWWMDWLVDWLIDWLINRPISAPIPRLFFDLWCKWFI